MKKATKKEFENAKKAKEFSKLMYDWWTKDKKLPDDDKDSLRDYPGTEIWAQWCREHLNKKVK